MKHWQLQPATLFAACPIIPVMVIEKLSDALPMAKALLSGGISVFEITLRTPVALEAIALIANTYPEAYVGAGTVLNPAQYDLACAAGAQFVISPGITPELLRYAQQQSAPLIPGVATPSEVMQAVAYGFSALKFFPAEINGGVKALAAISAPLPEVVFCPTGGINETNVKDYMALDCVAAVGGTWMLPQRGQANIDWHEVSLKAQHAITLTS